MSSNVFEVLGLSAGHRKSDKVVQRVLDYEKASKKYKPDDKLLWQIKYDGVSCIIISVEGEVMLFSRTGKRFKNVGLLELEATKLYKGSLDGLVLFAELHNDELSLEELGGIVNPNRTKSADVNVLDLFLNSRLACFDIVTKEEFINGVSSTSYLDRYSWLVNYLPASEDGTTMFRVFGDCCKMSSAQTKAKSLVYEGQEGGVFKDPTAGWKAGSKDARSFKIVSGVDYDLQVLGVEEGKGKREDMVANLIVQWRKYGTGEVVMLPVDGRFDDETRIQWWRNPSEIVGKIVHVHALCIGSKGSLRLAKVHQVRHDKDKPDI